jgi:hypothetical protein
MGGEVVWHAAVGSSISAVEQQGLAVGENLWVTRLCTPKLQPMWGPFVHRGVCQPNCCASGRRDAGLSFCQQGVPVWATTAWTDRRLHHSVSDLFWQTHIISTRKP